MARVPVEIPRELDVTRACLAYGERKIPKLNEELVDSDIVTLLRALRSLADLACSVLQAGEIIDTRWTVLDSLVYHLRHKDDAVRMLTSRVFEKLSTHTVCREEFVRKNIVDVMAAQFEDTVFEVRRSCYNALLNIVCTVPGATQVVDHGIMPKLLKQLEHEEVEIKIFILDILHHLLTVNIQVGLGCECLQAMRPHITSNDTVIREKATRCLMHLCTPLEGKQLALDEGFVPLAVKLVADSNQGVRGLACGVLMGITITTPGKYDVIKEGGLSTLMNLLDDQEEQQRMTLTFALKALTCLAEEPECKQAMMQDIEKFEKLTNHPDKSVCNTARTAMKVISWTP